MKLKLRTTYITNGDKRVCIAGLVSGEKFCGMQLYWSIQGDHYTEDGRFVSWSTKGSRPLEVKPHRILLLENALDSIKMEDTSAEAREWWNGVKT